MFYQLGRIICHGLLKNSVRNVRVLTAPKGSEVTRFISNSTAFQCLHRDNLKLNLYPADEDPVLESIFEASSVQQIFDIYNAIQPGDLLPKHSSQSLVTFWDLQKSVHQFGPTYRVHLSNEFLSQNQYIQVLRQHPTLQNIVQHVSTHCHELSDAALGASLLCMRKLKFEIRGEICQALIEEIRSRRSSLDVAALSRLWTILNDESSLYCRLIMAEFSPLLHSYINNMKTDEDVRLVSIAIRAAFRVATRRALKDYVTNINNILNNGTIQIDPITLMKILTCLIESQMTFQDPVRSPEEDLEVMGLISHLQSKVGNMLVPHVSQMGERDILQLSKFIVKEKDPPRLIEALCDRVHQLVQESRGNPSAELLACVRPTSMEQNLEIANFLWNVPDCDSFARIYRVAYRMLKRCMFDKDLFDKCWSFYQSIIERGVLHGVHAPVDWDAQNDFNDGDDSSFAAYGYGLPFVRYAIIYSDFRLTLSHSYRHRGFEATAKRLILQGLQNYEDGKCVITTQDYVKAIAFLVSIGHDRIRLKQLFMEKLRMPDLMLLHRATQLAPRSSWDISAAVMEQSRRFLKYDLTGMECIGLAEVNMRQQSLFDSNPMFLECMNKLEEAPWCDSRTATDTLQIIVSSAYNSSRMFQRVREYINKAEGDISLKCSARLIKASFICATDYMDEIQHAKEVIERNVFGSHRVNIIRFPLIESMLGLCYYNSLSKELVHKVFSVEFLHEVDKKINTYINTSPGGVLHLKLRDLFMQLNRAVCIDMPEAGVPWFHENYCKEIASAEDLKRSDMRQEVEEVLEEIFGSSRVANRVCSPYYYAIDCQVLFDSNGKVLPSTATSTAATKLAVLIHHARDYTCGDRRLKGSQKMKRRHLETLGYFVLDIDPRDWTSYRLSDRGAKSKFLQECIFGQLRMNLLLK